MKKINVKELIKYWQATAKHDYETMLGLFKIKRYSDCLFFGHIVLEKILKGLVVAEIKKQAPYIHDLVRLKEIANLNLSPEEISLLNKVNDFNIRSRYPEYKLQFYKTCTREYAKNYLDEIIILYKKLCRELKQKK
jgi:HEPN domain-containing protein